MLCDFSVCRLRARDLFDLSGIVSDPFLVVGSLIGSCKHIILLKYYDGIFSVPPVRAYKKKSVRILKGVWGDFCLKPYG